MKKMNRFAAFILMLVLILSLCGSAFAYSFFPSRSYMINFCNGDEALAEQKIQAYADAYSVYLSKYGEPLQHAEAFQRYRDWLITNGFTTNNGYSISMPTYVAFPKPYPVYPQYPQYLRCPIWGCPNPYGVCPDHQFSTPPAGYPVDNDQPVPLYGVPGAAPVAEAAAEPQRVVRLAASQEEYAVHFLTGETSVEGNRLVFKTKSRDTNELKRSDIFITDAVLTCADGDVYSWNFGEEDTGIARIEIAFGEKCKAQLTVIESNGYGSDDVVCKERAVSGNGGEAHILSLTAYDLQGNVVNVYNADGSVYVEETPASNGANG